MTARRLTAHDLLLFRDAVRAEQSRALAAANRMRAAHREDLEKLLRARAVELADLARTIETGGELHFTPMLRIVGRS